jgi:hypothetical protein
MKWESTLPTVLDKLNVMSTIHLRKLITVLVRENAQRNAVIDKLEERIRRLKGLPQIYDTPGSRIRKTGFFRISSVFPILSWLQLS